MSNQINNSLIYTKDQNLIDSTRSYKVANAMTRNNDLANIIKLLRHGANINFQDIQTGETAIHIAMHRNYLYLDLIKTLLEYKAELNIQDKYGETPLHIASKYRNSEFIKLLVEEGAYINIKADHGRTPLHHAIYLRRYLYEIEYGIEVETVNTLIQLGADINMVDHYGKSGLHGTYNVDTIDYLVDCLITLHE